MSICEASAYQSSADPAASRKRHCSFSYSATTSARPPKSPKLMTTATTLRRTESYLSLPGLLHQQQHPAAPGSSTSGDSTKRHHHTKERGRQRKAVSSFVADSWQQQDPFSAPPRSPPPTPPPPTPPSAAATATPRLAPAVPFRTSSPLNPCQSAILPARPTFPRSKAEPDLYRKAITTRMRCSPEGQKILCMGPRLALSIMAATKELERIVAAQTERERDRDGDVLMDDSVSMSSSAPTTASPGLSTSWVIVPGEDWEMIDCGA